MRWRRDIKFTCRNAFSPLPIDCLGCSENTKYPKLLLLIAGSKGMTRRRDAEVEMRKAMQPKHNKTPPQFEMAVYDKHCLHKIVELEALCAEIEENTKKKVRPWQGFVMETLRQGRDVMVRAGTGAGKSLCFQGLVFLRKGATVLVISPLVALMVDQVNSL